MKRVNPEIRKYVAENIMPEYVNFDEAHGVKHICDVRDRSIEYFNELISKGENLDINMVFIVACYHDIGMKIERKNHAIHSAEILLADENLKKWFSPEQIETMAQAVKDHSTSSSNAPESIYGMIVSDADKDRDSTLGIIRGIEFYKKRHKNFDVNQCAEDVHKEIVRRFGKEDIGGENLVKFYISSNYNEVFMKEMVEFAYNKEIYLKRFHEIIENEIQKFEEDIKLHSQQKK